MFQSQVSIFQSLLSQTFLPRYAKFSPFFARFVTLSPTLVYRHILYTIMQHYMPIKLYSYRRKNGCSRR